MGKSGCAIAACLLAGASWMMAGCGGGGSTTPPPPTTYTLTVNSANPSSGVSVGVSAQGSNAVQLEVTPFTQTVTAGGTMLLNASSTAPTGNVFSSWSGCTSVSGTVCTETVNGNVTVTANYAALITPTVTVTPSSPSITTSQSLTVSVAVSGGAGNPTATGSVTLTSGAFASSATSLSGGSASINISAGSLAAGSDTLTAKYAPDSASSATYASASGSGAVTVTAVETYVLTVKSAAPSSGVSITVTPADVNGAGTGTTGFTRTYDSGTAVTLTAPLSSGSYSFVSWSGCASNPSASICGVTMNANTTVTATFSAPSITSINVSPGSATIGTEQQFTATVNGTGNYGKSVTWALSCPLCAGLSPGTLSPSGLYVTPYPAPPSVIITATSTQDTSVSGSATVALNPPANASGPALTVDAGKQTHPINPLIYGMNAYSLSSSAAKAINLPVDRWGGDATSRYNYQLDVTSSASDWYFENNTPGTGLEATGAFNQQVISDASIGAKTLGTVPVLGWVAKNGTSCSFTASTYPQQVAFDPYNANCGDGLYPQGVNGCTSATGCNITGNDATLTSQQEGPSWVGDWVSYLVSKFGKASNGGVAIYDLDNEPAWWDAVHRDVHPSPSTYDEVTNNGLATAEAIKTADPSAAVSGPVVDYWWNYFYSKKDIENGWGTGPCYEPWSGPTDRQAHGGTPFIEYYLKQFKAAEGTFGARLLDYLDLHTYYAATYNGNSVAFGTAGDTGEQKARVNSTRVFWDPTYTDPSFPQPNYVTDGNYTANCSTPLQAPQLIPMAQKWVANDYPGTKVAFTEYNWGGQENINGAVAQADILGIFGSYGLDLATLWGPPNPTTQAPGLMAFEIYRNYDGKNSMFGDTALNSTSADQGQLSVYGAVRASDKSLTVMVINKTYGALTSAVSIQNFTSSSTTAQAFQYSNANLHAIVSLPAVTLTPPSGGGTASTITATFPAQSVTLLVAPN